MNSHVLIVILAVISATTAFHLLSKHHHHVTKTVVEDVNTSKGNISCWESDDEGNDPRLSDPIYKFCQIFVQKTANLLSGLSVEDNANEENIESFFKTQYKRFATTIVCVHEVMHLSRHPEFTFRCLCNRSGCNPPGGLEKMIEANEHVLPRHY